VLELKRQYNEELSNYRRAKGWLEEVKEGTRKASELSFAEAGLKLKRFMINLELIRIEIEKKGYVPADNEVIKGFDLSEDEVLKNQIKLELEV